MAIDWTRIGQAEFDRSVDCLLAAEWRGVPGASYHSPDGRGGDGGIDFVATEVSSKVIYQYKYFPDGLRTSGTSRKSQIRKSFRSALKHHPTRWVLVAPCKLTPQERTWVKHLGDGDEVEVEVIDRIELDLLLTRHDDVRRYLDRDVLLEAIQDYQVTTSAIRDGADLAERIQHLGGGGDDMDLYWRPEFSYQDGTASITPRAKTPDAPEKSPITFDLAIDDSLATEHQKRAVRRVLGYGVNEGVEFPANVALRSGPAFMSSINGPGILSLGKQPRSTVGDHMALELLNAVGERIALEEGVVTDIGMGADGGTIQVTFYSALRIRFLFDRKMLAGTAGTTNDIEVEMELDNVAPRDVRDSLALRRLLCAESDRLRLVANGEPMSTFGVSKHAQQEPWLEILEEAADDLDVVQFHSRTRAPMPMTWTPRDRILARIARLLVEGRTALFPDFLIPKTRTADELQEEGVRETLDMLAAPHAVVIRQREFALEFAGLKIDVGPVAVYSPGAFVEDADTMRDLVERGDGAGLSLALLPLEGMPWRATRITSDERSLNWSPTAWSLSGIEEHPALGEILKAIQPAV